MEKEEDDMNIDFGKILSFFKGKKEKSDSKVEKSIEKQTPSVSDEEDDNLGIDFGKIKNFFKPKDKQENKKESKKDDLGIDITKVYSFVKKHKVLLLLVLIIFLQFMPNGSFLPWGGIWMRMQTQNLPQTETWATNTVHSSIKIQIAGQINQQFPHLPDANKNKLIDEEFKKILKNKKGEINQQIQQTANFFLSKFQYEENGQTYTYMPDIDPYMFLLYARNYLDHGYTGDIKKDGINFDMHMTAPKGASVLSSIHPYTLAYIYKIFSIFNSNITLMQAACYFPIILILLSIIPAFLIGHKLAGNVGGFFSSAMIAVNNAAFNRTPWGHADTDAYNIFFPVFIIWIFFNSISAQNLKKKLFWGTCTGLALGVYSWAWGGWWYIFYFVLATIGITFLYQLFLYLNHLIKIQCKLNIYLY